MDDTPHSDQDRSNERPATSGIYDFLLGGASNFAADRQAAQEVVDVLPGAPEAVRLNRGFVHRAVDWLAERGIDQFLDVGSGGPGPDPVHQIAERVNPNMRVVYVDCDPVVTAYLSDEFANHPRVRVVTADTRDPETILTDPAVTRFMDLSRPVGIVMGAIVHFLSDEEHPTRVLGVYRDAVAPGSYLVVSHVTADHEPELVAEAIKPYERPGTPLFPRSHERLTGLLTEAGFTLVEPGVVWTPQWHPAEPDPRPPERAYCYAAVARRA